MSNKYEVSAVSQALVDELCEDAKSCGWEQDQGCGPWVDNAEKNFNNSKLALEQRIHKVERSLATARAKVRELRSIIPGGNP